MAQRPKSFAFGTGAAHAPQSSSLKRFFSELSLTNLALVALLALAVLIWVGFFAVNQFNNSQLEGRRANIRALIDSADFVKKEQDLIKFSNRVSTVHKAFMGQSHTANVLGFLEQYTHRQVQWTNFSLSAPVEKRQAVTDAAVKPIFDALKNQGQVKVSELSAALDMPADEIRTQLLSLVNNGWAKAVSAELFTLVPSGRTVSLSGVAKDYQTVAEQLVAFANAKDYVSRAVTSQLGLAQDGGVTFDLTLDITSKLLGRLAQTESQATSVLNTL